MLFRCSKCEVEKETSLFYKTKCRRGHTANCKSCRNESSKEYVLARMPEILASHREWRSLNKSAASGYSRKWRQANPEKHCAREARRRAAKLKAIPTLSEDETELDNLVIAEAYALAKQRTATTGVEWHVDHIVPLQSDKVCGLHYYANLRVITAKENQMKSNIMWEHMWLS